MIDFWSIFEPFSEPKSLQNRFQSGFGRALNEDSVSKLKKERSGSSAAAVPQHKLESFGASGGPKAPLGEPLKPHGGSWEPQYLEKVTNGATMQSFMILAQTICAARANIPSRL